MAQSITSTELKQLIKEVLDERDEVKAKELEKSIEIQDTSLKEELDKLKAENEKLTKYLDEAKGLIKEKDNPTEPKEINEDKVKEALKKVRI